VSVYSHSRSKKIHKPNIVPQGPVLLCILSVCLSVSVCLSLSLFLSFSQTARRQLPFLARLLLVVVFTSPFLLEGHVSCSGAVSALRREEEDEDEDEDEDENEFDFFGGGFFCF
jgi:hypothetical protein